jgi:hypothetical protein
VRRSRCCVERLKWLQKSCQVLVVVERLVEVVEAMRKRRVWRPSKRQKSTLPPANLERQACVRVKEAWTAFAKSRPSRRGQPQVRREPIRYSSGAQQKFVEFNRLGRAFLLRLQCCDYVEARLSVSHSRWFLPGCSIVRQRTHRNREGP